MTSIYQHLFEKYGFSPAQKIIIGLVEKGEVLEVGSSSGYMTKEFVKKGCLVDVVDIDGESLKKAAKIVRKAFIGSIEDENVQEKIDGVYDFIICADVLEHLVNPQKLLIFLKKKLKKDGKMLISIPNIAFWNMRLDLLRGRFEYQDSGLLDKTHLRFYTYDSFIRLVKGVGLKIVKIYPAESKIPLEYSFRKIPLLGKLIINLVKPRLVRTFPNLTYYHYVVQAKV